MAQYTHQDDGLLEVDNILLLLSEQIIDLVDGEILGLGQREQGEGEAGQHHAAVQVEGAVQVEAGLEQREQLERDHDQEAAEGPGHALQHGHRHQQPQHGLGLTLQNARSSGG